MSASCYRMIAASSTLAACLTLFIVATAGGQNCGPPERGPGLCPQSTGPDVIVGDLTEVVRLGTLNGRTAYALTTMSCNFGDTPIAWQALTANHPVIIQNMFRLKDDRLTQIGMSWAKHAFTTFQEPCCCSSCIDTGVFDQLNPGCSDIYNSGLNGNQTGSGTMGGLGPRFDINPATGAFPFPYTTQGQGGDVLYKRLQVDNDDLDPSLNSGARYFIECQYLAADDAAAGNDDNNASWREFFVAAPHVSGGYILTVGGSINVMQPAVQAWQANTPGVQITPVDVPGDGRMHLGWRVTDNGNGSWHYEYAIYNLNSDRAARGISIPSGSGLNVTSPGFHDIDHHSGEPYDPTDWSLTAGPASIEWSGDDYATNPNANAVRWGTMYNVWFDADAPPTKGPVQLLLFRPGAPSAMTVAAQVPDAPPPPPCPADIADSEGATPDGVVNLFDLLSLLQHWNADGPGADLADPTDVVNLHDLLELLDAWGDC